jgi:hypothetical protein
VLQVKQSKKTDFLDCLTMKIKALQFLEMLVTTYPVIVPHTRRLESVGTVNVLFSSYMFFLRERERERV